jgi:hypothetical protein
MSYDFDTTAREWGYTMQTLNQQDLDRNFALATTHIVKWMQAARMDMPWLGAGYKNLNQLEPPLERRLLVGSQMVRCASPGILTQAVGNEVVTQCEVGSIGNTSMEFRYRRNTMLASGWQRRSTQRALRPRVTTRLPRSPHRRHVSRLGIRGQGGSCTSTWSWAWPGLVRCRGSRTAASLFLRYTDGTLIDDDAGPTTVQAFWDDRL